MASRNREIKDNNTWLQPRNCQLVLFKVVEKRVTIFYLKMQSL